MLALPTLFSEGPAPEKWQVQGASRGPSGDKQAYGHPPLQHPPAPLALSTERERQVQDSEGLRIPEGQLAVREQMHRTFAAELRQICSS